MKNWWKRFSKFMALSLADQWLVLETGGALLVMKMGLKLLSFQQFKRVYSALVSSKKNKSCSAYYINRRVWAITKASSLLSVSCLPQALALTYFMRNDNEIDLMVGVRKSPTFEAHAWVEKNGKILIGELPDATFQPLWTWQ